MLNRICVRGVYILYLVVASPDFGAHGFWGYTLQLVACFLTRGWVKAGQDQTLVYIKNILIYWQLGHYKSSRRENDVYFLIISVILLNFNNIWEVYNIHQ